MKKIVLFLVGMMSVFAAQAQWSVAPEAGITAVNMNAGLHNDRWEAGWKLGVGVEYQLTQRFSLKSGLHYTQRGGTWFPLLGYDANEELYVGTLKDKRHFLQLPLMAQWGWNLGQDVRLNMGVGGYVAYDTHHSSSYGYYSDFNGEYGYGYGYIYSYGYAEGSGSNFFRGINAFDWGASLAVGLEVKNLYFNLGYDASLGKEYEYDSVGLNYHTLSLTVGYKFRLGK
ncbi:porin family protein [Parabacteroides sp. PF5-6]|uniref:porin family protein n=1 Tax=Parabacteroides sp. PF5-6 TaxID=1742403 RepID=UPI0024052BD6|nr:porin family protein [Parabacteroides sp. PF5-6]MDF9829968.1 hypothetical protein [Parabacteroides sp. PF5-6]